MIYPNDNKKALPNFEERLVLLGYQILFSDQIAENKIILSPFLESSHQPEQISSNHINIGKWRQGFLLQEFFPVQQRTRIRRSE